MRRPTADGGKLGVFAANGLLRSVLTVERRKGLRGQLRPFLAGMRTLPLCGVLLCALCLKHQFWCAIRIDDVPATSQGLLRKKWSMRQMETSDTHGNLFYSKGDRFHMCSRSGTL